MLRRCCVLTVPESVDPTEVSPSGPYRAYKTAGLMLLAAAWVLLGLVGHGPWKFDDATSFGVPATFEMTGAARRCGRALPSPASRESRSASPLLQALAAVSHPRALAAARAGHNAARLAVGAVLLASAS